MDIERYDGSRERRKYKNAKDMMEDAKKESINPNTKKITLHFPKEIILESLPDKE